MAKKIIISFNSLPTLGNAFNYNISINGSKIVYNSGVNEVNTVFKSVASTSNPPQSINIGTTIEECINQSILVLTTYFQYPSISYVIVDNTIEVLISDNNIAIELLSNGSSITTSSSNIAVTSALKYFLEYENIVNDVYKCNILQKNFTGEPVQIYGNVAIEKASAKDHLEPIRGTGLTLNLEATKDLTLEDLYTEDEQEFTIQLYKNNNLIFSGYLKPDGVFQDYVRDEWIITLDCIDGLGALKNLSFVKENGYHFTGKLSALDIIYNCLKRSGILLKINTSVNILYDGLEPSNNLDILAKTYINVDRFVKTDNETIMSCYEVLKSILDVFCAVITQIDGEWYIYKPNELYKSAYPLFRIYDIDNTFLGTKVINVNKTLGSQIDNFYPHHSGANQKIEIKGGVSAFRIGYKYGFVKGLIENNTFVHILNDYSPWIYQNPAVGTVLNDGSGTGIKIKAKTSSATKVKILLSENIPLNTGDSFNFTTNLTAISDKITFYFKVKIGGYYLNKLGEWVAYDNFISFNLGSRASLELNNTVTETFNFNCKELPVSGDLTIEVWSVHRTFSPYASEIPYGVVNKLDIINTFDGNNKVGEFHTVQRAVKISSIIKDNKEVFNGDNAGIVYYGALFKEDKTTLTQNWHRSLFLGNYPLLRIAAEEELRISQKPLKVFTGDIYGNIDYLNVVNINNVGEKFMAIEWSFDTKSNTNRVKYLELFAKEISDINYNFTYDYGETVKPTIIG